jgi:N-acetylglutamate synthase-like GNAT family acetyltransferase
MSCVEDAAAVFQSHRDELGFVSTAQCREKDLYTVEECGDVVGAAIANHCVRKPQTTLYDIAVLPAYRDSGHGESLIAQITRDSPHDQLIAKCPTDLPSNGWYDATGWTHIDTEPGKNRALNVWQYPIDTVDIITTGRPDLCEYAHKHGWLAGTRLDAIQQYENADISPAFIDVHWEDPDRDSLLSKTMQHQPKYVVAGDYDGDNHAEINEFASQLRQWADNVIIVPHEPGEVEEVPEWAVVGYSTPTQYEGTDAPLWEYYGRDVHVLGGTMPQIKLVVDHLRDDIVSLDTNTHHRDATQFGEYWSPSGRQRKQTAGTSNNIREAYQNAVLNMTYAFEQWGLI